MSTIQWSHPKISHEFSELSVKSTDHLRKKQEPCCLPNWLMNVSWAPTTCQLWILQWTTETGFWEWAFWGRGNSQKAVMGPPSCQISHYWLCPHPPVWAGMQRCHGMGFCFQGLGLSYGLWIILSLLLPLFEPIPYFCLKILCAEHFLLFFSARSNVDFSHFSDLPLTVTEQAVLRGGWPKLLLARMPWIRDSHMPCSWRSSPYQGACMVRFPIPSAPPALTCPCGKRPLWHSAVAPQVALWSGCFPDCFNSVQFMSLAPKHE